VREAAVVLYYSLSASPYLQPSVSAGLSLCLHIYWSNTASNGVLSPANLTSPRGQLYLSIPLSACPRPPRMALHRQPASRPIHLSICLLYTPPTIAIDSIYLSISLFLCQLVQHRFQWRSVASQPHEPATAAASLYSSVSLSKDPARTICSLRHRSDQVASAPAATL